MRARVYVDAIRHADWPAWRRSPGQFSSLNLVRHLFLRLATCGIVLVYRTATRRSYQDVLKDICVTRRTMGYTELRISYVIFVFCDTIVQSNDITWGIPSTGYGGRGVYSLHFKKTPLYNANQRRARFS